MSDHDDSEPQDGQSDDGLPPEGTDATASGPARRRVRRRRPLWLRLLSFSLTAGVIAGALLVLVTLPKLNHAMEAGPVRTLALTVLDNEGNEIGSRGGTMAPVVPIGELPPYLIKAFVDTEDQRFYSHHGIDMRGIARATLVNIWAGRFVEGGSTITQQLAKNLYLDSDRTLWRKAQEALIAFWIEANYTKDEILTAYLNRVYMGAGNYGIDAAAHYYFGKSARDVSLPEAAVLAGLPKAPSRFAPTNDLALALKRANTVLDRMVSNGDLTAPQANDARAHPAVVATRERRDGPQYFVDWVANELHTLLPDASGRLIVKTTLDPARQRAAEAAIARALKDNGGGHDVTQGAAIALDTNGAILAMVGGKSYLESQFNRATQAERQPGSAFKPVVYLTALEKGFRPNTEVTDSPVMIGEWAPQNSNAQYVGSVTLTEALARSINTVAVKLADRVGVAAVADTAARLGILSPIQSNLTVALGSSEVTLLELTSAYSTFATDGRRSVPFGVTEITNMSGETLYKNTPASFRVTDPKYAHSMTYMLHQVMTHGTGRRAALGDRQSAGKTGTSQDYRDAWFIGYTGSEIAGVWFGNDDNSPTKRASGGGFAAVAWHNYMTASQKNVPPVALAGASRYAPSPSAPARDGALVNFLSQLADLFEVAPRLDAPQTNNFSSGRQLPTRGLQLGGGRPR